MKIDLSLNGISCFGTTLPFEPSYEVKYKGKSRKEIIAGWHCVYNAAEDLGLELSLLNGVLERGLRWPAGVIGSISHSKKFAIGCVGRVGHLKSIGIHTEVILSSQTTKDIKEVIALDSEKDLISQSIPEKHHNLAYSILYSGKEALFKALHPLSDTSLSFQDVQMNSLCLKSKTFKFELSESAGNKSLPPTYNGFYVSCGDNLISVFPVPH